MATAMGNASVERGRARQHEDQQDLLRRVRDRGQGIGREDREAGGEGPSRSWAACAVGIGVPRRMRFTFWTDTAGYCARWQRRW